MTDFTEARIGTCPYCKRRFCVEEGELCDCQQVVDETLEAMREARHETGEIQD